MGILPYLVTFLVTDLISEIYGKKKANQVVIAGIIASAFLLLIIMFRMRLMPHRDLPWEMKSFIRY
jgi:uncharacterized PurR-regulated membrane protein YhhQ (DUF165 family)